MVFSSPLTIARQPAKILKLTNWLIEIAFCRYINKYMLPYKVQITTTTT